MQVVVDPQSLGEILKGRHDVGFVPTMGALHGGHRALITQARRECATVVVSIFVNPLQFGAGEDLDRYPRSPVADRELCRAAGVDVLFCPTADVLIPRGTPTQVVPPPEMTEVLCGRSRPGHFTGVATIVVVLLHLIRPRVLYLGQKDGQQVAILRRVCSDLHLGVEVRVCPTQRLPSGLALSSRNRYLAEAEGAIAAEIYGGLRAAQHLFDVGTMEALPLIEAVRAHIVQFPQLVLEYIALVDAPSLRPLARVSSSPDALAMLAIAAKIGLTRLIDNLLLTHGNPTQTHSRH